MNNNISLIPKSEKARGLPRFVSFQGPKLELTSVAKLGLAIVLLLLLFAGGFYGWQLSLKKELGSLNNQLQSLTSQRDLSLEERLKNINSLMGLFGNVLKEHRYWSQFFNMLEQKTLNNIVFSSFQSDSATASVTLEGRASSFNVLAEQIKTFEEASNVSKIDIAGVSLSEDGWVKFSLKIGFDQKMIMKL